MIIYTTHGIEILWGASIPHVGQIYHDLDHLNPNLPLCGAVQELYSTDPTHRKHVLGRADYMAPTQQSELDLYRPGIYLP